MGVRAMFSLNDDGSRIVVPVLFSMETKGNEFLRALIVSVK